MGGNLQNSERYQRTCVFMHVPFEGPAQLGAWAIRRGDLRLVRLYSGEAPPAELPDNLVIMGGPMGVADIDRNPWMMNELRYLERAMAGGVRIIGVCLGAQLVAHALGARVFANEHKEIGWHDVWFVQSAAVRGRFPGLPERAHLFHWHGDTFDIPRGAMHLAASDGCVNQAFVYGENILALQFHAEATSESVSALLTHCKEDLIPGPFVQNHEEILVCPPEQHRFETLDILLRGMKRRPPGDGGG